MRFMIIVKSTPELEAETTPQVPDAQPMVAMADYMQELSRAGVLLDGSGLQPSRKGWRIHHDGQKRTVIDGPFSEARELIAGFTIIQVRSREEAMEWSRRYPHPAGDKNMPAVIEVRQLHELEDCTTGGPGVFAG